MEHVVPLDIHSGMERRGGVDSGEGDKERFKEICKKGRGQRESERQRQTEHI